LIRMAKITQEAEMAGKKNAKMKACQNGLTDKTKGMCPEKTARDPKEGAGNHWRAVEEMDKVLTA
jgi:ribosome modulation factor